MRSRRLYELDTLFLLYWEGLDPERLLNRDARLLLQLLVDPFQALQYMWP